ncbi:MAG: sensor histidine kinase [Bacteroidota bacterium]
MEAIRRVNIVASELVNANVALQNYVDQSNDQAARRERLALSRELHDTVAYTFTTIAASIELAAELIDRDREAALAELRHARKLTIEGLREVRGIVRAKREEAERGFWGLGRWGALVDVFKQATGVIVTLDVMERFPELIDELDDLVYHLIQEGMINAYRHGHATVIWVKVWIERAHLCVTVSDNGCGTDQLGSGFGIMGMQERVHALGGRISWRTAPGAGFVLAVEIPLEEKEST